MGWENISKTIPIQSSLFFTPSLEHCIIWSFHSVFRALGVDRHNLYRLGCSICIAMITLLMILLTTILSFLLQEMPKPSVMITPHALEDSCRCVLIPSSRSKAASSRIIYWSNPGLLHNHHKRETTMYSISSQLQLRFVSKCIRRQLSGEGMRDSPPLKAMSVFHAQNLSFLAFFQTKPVLKCC